MPVGSDGGTVRIGLTAAGRSDGGLGAEARRAGAAARRAGVAARRAGVAAERARAAGGGKSSGRLGTEGSGRKQARDTADGGRSERRQVGTRQTAAGWQVAGGGRSGRGRSERRRGAQEQQARDTAGRGGGRSGRGRPGCSRPGCSRPGRRKIRENFCFPKIWLPLQPTARPNARKSPERSSGPNGAVRQVKPLNKSIMDEGPDQNCEFTDLFTNP